MENMVPFRTGRASRTGMEPVSTAPEKEGQTAIFDAVLYPHRSLPNTGFAIVMGVVIAVNLLVGGAFFALGAWPVVGFCGLDVAVVWLAFRLSYRQGRLREWVRVAGEEMWVARVLPSGHEMHWRLQPFWTRVTIDRPVEHDSQLRLVSKGKTLILGAFLSPRERERFADALASALHRARAHG